VQKTISVKNGIYILEIFAKKDFTILAKKFIDKTFPKGYYYYIGSAQRNLDSRLSRHKKANKKIHWHIDHLTTLYSNIITNIFVFDGVIKEGETYIASNFQTLFNADIIVSGFGNSDTPNTKTHLFFKKTKINSSNILSLKQTLISSNNLI